jgi:hypothetical protein
MASKRSPISTLVVLAVLFAGIWLYFTPYLALNRLQKAADRGDQQAMQELVDFPSLRESVKTGVRSSVENAVGRRAGPVGMLGGLLAGAVTSPLVDAFVTPQGIAALTQGQRPGEGDGGAEPGRSNLRVKGIKTKRRYESFDRFVVRFVDKESGEERMSLVMHRDGITNWRLSGVRFPGPGTNGD